MASATARASWLRRGLAQLARIRYRLLLVNVIVAAVPLVGISFAELHETQLLGALEADMIHQAELVRALVLASPDRQLASFEPLLAAAATETHTRIRLLDRSGAVRADSHRDGPPEGEEAPVPRLLRGAPPRHAVGRPAPLDAASRREVKTALAGRYGSATRLWGHQDRVFLFSALPILAPRSAARIAPQIPAVLRASDDDAAAGQPVSGAPRTETVAPPPVAGDADAPDGHRVADAARTDTVAGDADSVSGVVYVTRSTHDVKLQLYRLRTWLFRVLAFTLALTSLVTLILATTIARPLGRLTRRAQRIAARQPVEPDRLAARADEIGQLARAVEAMTTELERRAHDARTLAADLSHEFKTPLTAIRGAAELLRDGASDDPTDRDRFLAMILDDAARLDRLVSRLLELARVDDDRGVELPVDLVALARDCAARPWPVVVETSVTAAWRSELRPPPRTTAAASVPDGPGIAARAADPGTIGELRVSGRRTQLAAALENLVANATQFAAPGTPVHIAIGRRAAAVRITVTNHGPALSAAARARVWDRFYSTRTSSGGSGLGLAIVRSVALGHGGSVGVDCVGGLTSFWLELRALCG